MDTAQPAPIGINVPDPIPLAWLSEGNIWVDQWPILEPKFSALKELVLEILALGYLESLTSRHNIPISVIKKSGKYRLLQEIRAINEHMTKMRTTQSGLPHPSAIPPKYHVMDDARY